MRNPQDCFVVITGLVPVISLRLAMPRPLYRDCRDKPGNDDPS